MTLLPLTILLAQAQTISFSLPVTPLYKVVPELAKLTGKKLEVSPDVKWRMVFIRVKDVTQQELMTQVGRATGTRWEQLGDTLYLNPDPKVMQAEKEKSQRRLRASIESFLKTEQGGAVQKAAQQMLKSIGVDRLATIEDDSRVVFSTNPTRMQNAFPSFDPKWVTEITKEHNQSIEGRSEGRDSEKEMYDKMEELVGPELGAKLRKMEGLQGQRTITEPITKVLLILERRDSSVMGRIRMYDGKGKMAVESYLWLGNNEPTEEDMTPLPTEENEKKATNLALSAECLKRVKLIGGMMHGGNDRESYRQELRKLLAKPDEYEIVFDILNDYLQAYGKSNSENLVISPSVINAVYGEAATTDRQLRSWITDKSVDPEGWRVYAAGPNDWDINFDTMRALIELATNEKLSLDDRAIMAATVPTNLDRLILYSLYSQVFGISGDSMPGLKLYGLLSAGQRKAAWTGQPITIASLSPKAKSHLNDMAFKVMNRFTPSQMGTDMMEMMTLGVEKILDSAIADMEARNSYLSEPTESMPNGLPNDGIIKFTPKVGKGYFIGKQGGGGFGPGMPDSVDLERLATIVAMSTFVPQEAGFPRVSEVTEVELKELKVRMRPTPGLNYYESLYDHDPSKDGKKIELKSWPEFQTLLAETKKRVEKMGMLMGVAYSFQTRPQQQAAPPR